MGRRMLIGSLRALVAFVLAVAAVLAVQIWTFDSALPDGARLDAAIVLGAASYGGKPSPVFAGRLEYGEQLLRRGIVRFVIVTGGGRDDPSQPEARAGAQYLRDRGNDPARILLETRSFTTPENLCHALQAAAPYRLRSYAIVSDPLHLRRAMHYARDLGMHARPAGSPFTRYRGLGPRLAFLARETYVYGRHLLGPAVRCRP